MSHVVVIGCGVVGAAIAYELSLLPGLSITVLDKQPPATAATKAALGVLMGVISHKIKGNAWKMRQASIQRYETLIPELEALSGRQIPFNRQGILMLCFEGDDLASWEKLVEIRKSQGWQLEIWDAAQLQSSCPQLNCEKITAAVYSPQDRQVDPVALTLALVDAAQRNGVTFHFGVTVEGYDYDANSENQRLCRHIQIKSVGNRDRLTSPPAPLLQGEGSVERYFASFPPFPCREGGLGGLGLPYANSIESVGAIYQSPLIKDVDWLVVAAGLGSLQLTASLQQEIDIRPVLGQALHLRLRNPMGNPDFQPVITGDDVHIVPVGKGEYWVGATVEFPTDGLEVVADASQLEVVRQQAIAFCPALAEATLISTWSGLRPRPEGRPAPVIGHLPGYSNILLATGHYRNGVLLAPATAQAIREIIIPA